MREAESLARSKEGEAIFEEPLAALARFGYRFAALDWFREQTEDQAKCRRRGLRPEELLDKRLGLLDESCQPLPAHSRATWERLRGWLEDDGEILRFAFPEGISQEDRAVVLADLVQIRKQPWSPVKAVEALLEVWPPGEAERPYTLEAADRVLHAACTEALARMTTEEPQAGGPLSAGSLELIKYRH